MNNTWMKRLFSLVLALIMVLSLLPTGAIKAHAAQTETKKVTDEDLRLEIDYDKPFYKVDENGDPVYDENGQLTYLTPQQALSEEAEKNRTVKTTYSNGKPMDHNYYWSTDNQDEWRQVFKGDAKAKGGNFRKWMTSSNPDDARIVLMESMKITVGTSSDWETIKITSDKVLDLNGYSLELYDKRNGTEDQKTGDAKHQSTFFEINNGAQLTIIDSRGASIRSTDAEGKMEESNKSEGRIFSNAYMINHQKWDLWYYTHRDIFHVVSGDLVIYGGNFQAGRQKDQVKSNFSWKALKSVIGDAVTLGTSIYEYATGITAAEAARADLLGADPYKDLKEEMKGNDENENDSSSGNNGKTAKKDGTGGTDEKKTETPASAGDKGDKSQQKNQTVAQKQTENNKKEDDKKKGDKSTDNKADGEKPAKKDPTSSQIAEANKAIGMAYLDKDKISDMVDKAITFGENLYDLFGSDEATRATACIHGTVARIGNGSTAVIYDGYFTGHGSTPNVRNAVFEVSYSPVLNGISATNSPLNGKTNGGLMYVYGGTFTGSAGANVFNMYKTNERLTAVQYEIKTEEAIDPQTGRYTYNSIKTAVPKQLAKSETFGIEEVRYESIENWAAKFEAIPQTVRDTYDQAATQEAKEAVVDEYVATLPVKDREAAAKLFDGPEIVKTANIMVRGGTFRTYYEPSMMAIMNLETKGTDRNDGKYCPIHDADDAETEKFDDECDDCDDQDHFKFSGTPGTVNLGVESYGEDMIRDGRIQLVDVYGQGNLVLLDGGDPIDENPNAKVPQDDSYVGPAPENTYTTEGGFRHYRLFISDNELRGMNYLTVYPNTALTNSTFSFALETHWGNGTKTTEGWKSDADNIRAPYSSNEKYFEFEYDDLDTSDQNSGGAPGVYIIPNLNMTDPFVAGEELAQSNVWYYNIPVNAKGEALSIPYSDNYVYGSYNGKNYEVSYNRVRKEGDGWDNSEYNNMNAWNGRLSNRSYAKVTDENYLTNIKFFTYKVYRVDPLSRENINEGDQWSDNEPLIEVRYGASNQSLKCKITLKTLEKKIAEKKGDPNWTFRSGELYRVEFLVEEHLGYGYMGTQNNGTVNFLNTLSPAKAETSILFRCVEKLEDKVGEHYNETTGVTVKGEVPDWTPLQFVKKDSKGNYYKDETLIAGSNATVELVNGQPSLVDWRGSRVFDVYYQWYILDDPDDTTPKLIAGTDNVWVAQNSGGGKSNHKPDNWILKNDGSGNGVNDELYANTIDPDSPEASMYTYYPNGLPMNTENPAKSTDLWDYKMLHMYTQETCSAHDGMKKYPEIPDLDMGNNNPFWGNTDSVYIPTEYAGKYLQCKMVVVNTEYPHLYDNLQTIVSHAVKIDGPSLPAFDTVTPAVTEEKLEAGTTNLGILTEKPTFAFTYTDIAQKYINAGYQVKPTITVHNLTTGVVSSLGLTDKAGCEEGWTPYYTGQYEVNMELKLIDPSGNELDGRAMVYKFTLSPVEPNFTNLLPRNPTEEEKKNGVIDLGEVSQPPTFGFTYQDTMPDWMTEQGYTVHAFMDVYTNGVKTGTVTDVDSWTPSGFGDRMVIYRLVLDDPIQQEVASSSFTYTFSMRAPGVDFTTMTPVPTDAEREAGVTALGTVTSVPYFGFGYINTSLPEWMRDAGYRLEGDMTILRDGVEILHNNGESVRPEKRAGEYQVTMVLKLVDNQQNVVDTAQHRYTYTVAKSNATYVTVTNLQDRYIKGETYTLEHQVGPVETADQSVTWYSSDESVAVVDENGVLYCLDYGEATITVVTADETLEASYNILVTNEGTVYVGGIGLKVGEYLPSGSLVPTTTKPTEGGYAYLSTAAGLELHDFTYHGKFDGIVGPTSATRFVIRLSGNNHLDMTPSREASYSYEYYNAKGIQFTNVLDITANARTATLRFTGCGTGISASSVNVNERVQLTFDKAGTATDISTKQLLLTNATVDSANGLYISALVRFTNGTYRIITEGTAVHAQTVTVVDGADVRIVSTDSSGIALSGTSCRLNVTSGNLYVEGKTCAVGSSQKGYVQVTPASGYPDPNLLLVSSAEGEPNKGARDSLNSAINFGDDYTATLISGSPYKYGSTERYGENGEVYTEDMRGDYDFVFIGTDPRVFGTTVYVNPDCTAQWDASYPLTQYDNVTILMGHTLEYHKEIPAGCETTGVCEYWYCTDYRKMYADEACTTEITDTTLEALEHDWLPADCTQYRHCDRCGVVDDRYAPYGHSWYPATCMAPAQCRRCNETMGAPIDHIWIEADCWMGKHCDMCWMEISDPLGHILEGELEFPQAKPNCSYEIEGRQWCSRCEEYVWINVDPVPGAHIWVGGDCTTPAQCEICGIFDVEGVGHKWNDATCDAPKTCSVCSITEGTALGHDWIEATCEHPKACLKCGATDGAALPHTWQAATCEAPMTCSVCWTTEGSKTDHSFVDHVCTVCEYKEVDIAITSVGLRSNCTGLYFNARFDIDDTVSVNRQGIVLSLVNDLPVADGSDPTCLWTNSGTSALVKNILSTVNSDADNALNSTMPIYARAYAELSDGTIVYSAVAGVNLLEMVQKADAQWYYLTDAQKTALKAMYAMYTPAMEKWALPNMKEEL